MIKRTIIIFVETLHVTLQTAALQFQNLLDNTLASRTPTTVLLGSPNLNRNVY